MIIGRLVGWIFILGALAVVAMDMLDDEGFEMSTVGGVWRSVHFDSMVGLQFFLNDVAPWLWDPAIVTVLLWPAVAVFGVLGLAFVILFRRR